MATSRSCAWQGSKRPAPAISAFYTNSRYAAHLKRTAASAVILADKVDGAPCAVLRTTNPYLAFANAVVLFADTWSRRRAYTGLRTSTREPPSTRRRHRRIRRRRRRCPHRTSPIIHAHAAIAGRPALVPTARSTATCRYASGSKLGTGSSSRTAPSSGATASASPGCPTAPTEDPTGRRAGRRERRRDRGECDNRPACGWRDAHWRGHENRQPGPGRRTVSRSGGMCCSPPRLESRGARRSRTR